MTRKDFFQPLHETFSLEEVDRIARAYMFAKETHRMQKPRDSGERYFEHCRRVAMQVLNWGYRDVNATMIGFLHDCEEDGFLAPNAIHFYFGEEIARDVSLLSKTIPIYDSVTRRIIKREKKILGNEYFVAIATADWRVRAVKCADRVDNLSSMRMWNEDRQRRYIRETEMYIIPIAETLGQNIVNELYDLCVLSE